MAITVPGKSALLLEQTQLTDRKTTNLSKIAALEAENTQIDQQQVFITATLDFMVDLAHLPAPADFAATVIGSTAVDLNWTNDTNAAAYIVKQGIQPDYSDAAEIFNGAYPGTLHLTSLTTNVTYYWEVRATAPNKDDSEWSQTADTPT